MGVAVNDMGAVTVQRAQGGNFERWVVLAKDRKAVLSEFHPYNSRSMAIYELDSVAPRLAESAWVADSAHVIGNVELVEDTRIWFGTIIRGDS